MLYRAKVVQPFANGSCRVQVPQVFGDSLVTVTRFNSSSLPLSPGLGWVSFEGLSFSYPVWMGADPQIELPGDISSDGPTVAAGSGEAYGALLISTSTTIDAALLTGTVNSARLSGAYTGITGLGTLTSLSVTGALAAGATTITGALSATSLSGTGTSLTALNATELTSGTIPSARVSGAYTGIDSVGTLGSLTVTGTVSAATFSGSGASLTSLNASNLASGTVPSAVISGSYANISGIGTITNSPRFNTPAGNNITMTGGHALEVFQPNAGTDAYVTFHVSGDFAAEFGLAGDINDFAYGGWSFGGNKYRVMSAYNTSSGVQAFSPYFSQCFIVGGISSSFTESNANLRVKSSSTATGISVTSHSASNVPDYLIAFYDVANGANSIGSIVSPASTSSTSYLTTSDYRLKRDDNPITDALGRLLALRPISYKWSQYEDSPTEEGFFAHEVQAVVPTAVMGEKDAEDENGNIVVQQLDLSKLVPLLVGAVQELAQRIEALEA